MTFGSSQAPSGARVLVLSFTDLARDPRVNRQIRFLASTHRVIAVGLADPRVPGVRFVPLAPKRKSFLARAVGAARLLARRYEAYYWNRSEIREGRAALAGIEADVLVANDIDTLPLALEQAGPSTVLFDAHEYAPLEFEESLRFRLLQQPYRYWLCRTFIPRVHAMTTVCDSIADAYERDTGVHASIVLNAPDYEELRPSSNAERSGQIRLVHHGGAARARGIAEMIRAVRMLDERFTLDLFLVGTDTAYIEELRREARGEPRIRFNDPIPMRDLPRVLNAFDVGLYMLQPTSFNNRFALPNKLFEFVQARLAVAIGPSPEMARIVNEYQLGVVAGDFRPETMARLLAQLDPGAVARMKANADAASRVLSADAARETITRIVGRLAAESR